MLERIQLLRNIGQFDSVNSGAQLPFAKLTLVHAENGRGKTTLASILRSLATGVADLISERHRLGAVNPPHIVLSIAGSTVQFCDGAWPTPMPEIAVFDDHFVATNVCSGVDIEPGHGQNLHELILGAQGVALNYALQKCVSQIEEHNKALAPKSNAIPAASRGVMSVEDFCALAINSDVEAAIKMAERNLAAARSADTLRQRSEFQPFSLPNFDISAIHGLLTRTLPELEAEAAARVKDHLRSLGRNGEAWVGEGMTRIQPAPDGSKNDVCPFCAQDLVGSPVLRHYQAYFSEAYRSLRTAINDAGQSISSAHAGDVPAAFERAVRVAIENRAFWHDFTDIPEISVDTAAVLRAWTAARDAVLTALRRKAAAPLDRLELTPDVLSLIQAYEQHLVAINTLSNGLIKCNLPIAIVKEKAAVANVAVLAADLSRLQAVQWRHSEPARTLCADYLAEKALKVASETERRRARAALDNYRQNIFPAYEAAINFYLQRFSAGFRLKSVNTTNTRGGSSCTYNILINNVPVSLTADAGPAFRNTQLRRPKHTSPGLFLRVSRPRPSTCGEDRSRRRSNDQP